MMLKRKSFYGYKRGNTEIFREYGAVVFEMNDGKIQAFRYTSNNFGSLLLDDQMRWINDSTKFEINPDKIRRIYVVHTHPYLEDAQKVLGHKKTFDMLSEEDIKNANLWTGFLRNSFESKNLPVEAVVLPHCKDCEDLFFSYIGNTSISK